jgi:hypothetical protein
MPGTCDGRTARQLSQWPTARQDAFAAGAAGAMGEPVVPGGGRGIAYHNALRPAPFDGAAFTGRTSMTKRAALWLA